MTKCFNCEHRGYDTYDEICICWVDGDIMDEYCAKFEEKEEEK